MNKEELIKVLKDWKPELELMAKYNDNPIDYQRYRALDETTKALEQGSILDKIRTEIEHLTITEGGEDYTRKMAELYSLKIKVLQIIDKYRQESEK